MKKFIKIKRNRGMTYVELIVVLSIFAVMSSVVVYNYGDFQAKVDTKNLATDIALRVVEAQKSSVSGILPPLSMQTLIESPSTWKPSYGVYFNVTPVSQNKNFTYFTDLDNTVPAQNGLFDGTICTGECLSNILITKGNSISRLDVYYQGESPQVPHVVNDLTITFKRPDSGAVIKSTTSFGSTVSYAQITIASPKTVTATIKVYASGRIQVN